MHANIFHRALEVMIVAHKTVPLNYLVIVIEEMRSEPPDCVHKLLFIFRQRCQNTGIRTTTVLTEIGLVFFVLRHSFSLVSADSDAESYLIDSIFLNFRK